MMPHPSATTSSHPSTFKGFTITELLVAIAIVAVLLGISFPFISAMTSGSRVQAGLNTAGMSSDVARQWVQAVSWANDGGTTAPTGESYSGTAAIFCPTNEIRIVLNDRNAQATSGTPAYLEDRGTELNGYHDLSQVEYIRIPSGVGVVGIERFGPNANDIRFIAPPFAIAYNELGQLNYGDANGYIYYNGDGLANYNLNKNRTSISGYNPADWDRDSTNAAPNTGDTRLKLPFEAIECVAGVLVFSLDNYQAASHDFAGGGRVTLGSNAGRWLQENGETIFFSPHTGVALRDEQE